MRLRLFNFINKFIYPVSKKDELFIIDARYSSIILWSLTLLGLFNLVSSVVSATSSTSVWYNLVLTIACLFGNAIYNSTFKSNRLNRFKIVFVRMYTTCLVFIISIIMWCIFDEKNSAVIIIVGYMAFQAFIMHLNPFLFSFVSVAMVFILKDIIFGYYQSSSFMGVLYIAILVIDILAFHTTYLYKENIDQENEILVVNLQLQDEIERKSIELDEEAKKQIKMQEDIIYAMAELVETRDGDTGEHIKRTRNYVEIIAKEAQRRGLYPDELTDEYIDTMCKAAPMHDVGKIAISDAILNAPRKLTKEEFEFIKMHTVEGDKAIQNIFSGIETAEYITVAREIALSHHEKWDGSGYPNKLKGNQIPLSARIMAIADVFDALVSKRCYKDAMTYDEAFQIIKDGAGSHFDSSLVDVFLSMRQRIEQEAENNRE